MDLSDFLLARIAEDEEVALAALSITDDWKITETASRYTWPDGEIISERHLLGWELSKSLREGAIETQLAEHIARWAPDRVLAKCAADRRIVLLADAARDDDDDLLDQTRVISMRLLALPYADHPEFREEWKP